MERRIKIGLVGAGMFGGDVHLRAYADLQLAGIVPHLAGVGLDKWGRDLAGIEFSLEAIATRTRESALGAQRQFQAWTGHQPKVFCGEKPWLDLLAGNPGLDVLAVATPDHLHTEPSLAALEGGAHVIVEKPMCLDTAEADQLLAAARRKGLLIAVDMHKRYDPDHAGICRELKARIGEPLYGLAYLEEPLQVSAQTFKWVQHSDPFSYVGSHWVDLLYHYYHSKPVSLTAVGQKRKLAREGIDAYDAVQVRVDYDNGMSISYHNNWVTPADFEGPVNQGHELVGTDGKVESDQQYRGLRWWAQGSGSRTANTHFSRQVRRPDGSNATVGYGIDSIIASLAAVCRVKFFGATREDVKDIYPNAEEARITVAIVHAARIVRDLNFRYLQAGKGAAVAARFGPDGIIIVDPNQAENGAAGVFQRIYDQAV